jgi:ABC-type ATPase with predicted acetyltransferase domain
VIVEIDNVLTPDYSYAAERTRGLYNVDASDGAEFHLRADLPIIAALTQKESYAKATAALAAVGLGSIPSWLRPYRVLSNGEQFRAGLAELLLDTHSANGRLRPDVSLYIDEFTSVLDRQVAKIGAGAFAKQWRRQPDRRVILITPHYDILDWVEPDWWLDTAGGEKLPGEERKVVSAQKGTFQAGAHRARYRGDPVGSVEC